jgi:outer membrane protein
MRLAITVTAALALGFVAPAAAQDAASEPSVFDGDHLSVGLGVGYQPSYIGSDDYVVFPTGLVQGSFHGISISSRATGIALDFVPNPPDKIGLNLGIVADLRLNRSRKTHDAIVDLLKPLDRAVELGPSIGISIPHVLNAYDSLSLGVDAAWDVTGTHDGMVVSPHMSYQTPLSRGILADLSATAVYGDGNFTDYYFSVTPADAAITGLPQFHAKGGFNQIGSTLFVGFDLDGNLRNGGPALFAIGGYTRVLGDAKRSPFTSIRGSADQWYGGIGFGYTF